MESQSKSCKKLTSSEFRILLGDSGIENML
jgi:hypothetical protein